MTLAPLAAACRAYSSWALIIDSLSPVQVACTSAARTVFAMIVLPPASHKSCQTGVQTCCANARAWLPLCCQPTCSRLLVRATELGERAHESDESVTVAGQDRGRPFDHRGRDRIVVDRVPSTLDTNCRVVTTAKHAGLRPERGIPQPPRARADMLEQLGSVNVGG